MEKFKKFFRSEFAKNVLTLMTGTVVAQAIPIAISPILTRIYSPDDFGILALFISITAITGVVANAKYEQALVLPKLEEDAFGILILGLLISLGISLALLIIIILFEDGIISILKEEEIRSWLYLIPISTFLIGLYNMFNFYNIRNKNFKNVSKALIYKSTGLSIGQIVFSFIKHGPFGLILGQVVSFVSGNYVLIRDFKSALLRHNIDKRHLSHLAKKYKKFPIFSMPSVFINSLNLNMINFLISTFYTVEILGFYSLTQRIIGIPSRVLGNSFGQVYFQKATLEFQNSGKTITTFNATFKKLVLVGLPLFSLLFFISEPLFGFVFGEEWRIAGYYSKILMPLAYARFVSSALSTTMTIHMKQQLGLGINIFLIIISISVFIFSEFNSIGFEKMLMYFSFFLTCAYLMFIYLYWYIAKSVN